MKTAKTTQDRLETVQTALERLAFHMEGIPYHPCVDKSMNWWAAASSEIDDILEEMSKKDECEE